MDSGYAFAQHFAQTTGLRIVGGPSTSPPIITSTTRPVTAPTPAAALAPKGPCWPLPCVATVSGTVGRNRVKRAASGRLEAVKVGSCLCEGDVLTTVAGGRVTLVWAGGVYQTINAGEAIRISAVLQVADPSANLMRTTARMASDAARDSSPTIAALGGEGRGNPYR